MTPEDGRILAELILLHKQLPGIMEELIAGKLNQGDRECLAISLATIAAQVNPDLLLTEPATDPAEPGERAQPQAARLRPSGPAPRRLPFSSSGP